MGSGERLHIVYIILFIIGYTCIAFEHPLKINKGAPALFFAMLAWGLEGFFGNDPTLIHHEFLHHLSEIAQITFFLLGAMVIVEIMDAHRAFSIITNRITTKNKRYLLVIIVILTFFLSPFIDNLTASIVAVTLLNKLVHEKSEAIVYSAIIIIAANAGGAASIIGDITTTMLWIGGQISPLPTIKAVLVPSIVSVIVPTLLLMVNLKGKVTRRSYDVAKSIEQEKEKHSLEILILGLLGLLSVPLFKTFTHLPPMAGMLFSLGLIRMRSESLHTDKTEEERKGYSAVHALQKLDHTAILFFTGILFFVGLFQSNGTLIQFGNFLEHTIGNSYFVITILGILSAIIDNVPLVAAAQGMYSLETFPLDSSMRHYLAYAAGTGGSMLIIGSAAGVIVMAMQNISFGEYFKKFSLVALIGYFAGCGTFFLVNDVSTNDEIVALSGEYAQENVPQNHIENSKNDGNEKNNEDRIAH